MPGSREISLVPSLHRASVDALCRDRDCGAFGPLNSHGQMFALNTCRKSRALFSQAWGVAVSPVNVTLSWFLHVWNNISV